jgi:hypothetical protein
MRVGAEKREPGKQMRRSALGTWAALLAWVVVTQGAAAQDPFGDFPDDAGGAPTSPAPPAAPSTPPRDAFDDDFGAAPPAAPSTPATSPAPPAAPSTPAPPQASTPAEDDVAPLRPPATEADLDAGGYAVRLRELEQSIHELKEQIFRSKARLALLAETVLQGISAGAKAHIVHHDEMGASYRLVRATYAIDGAPIFNRQDDEGSLAELDEFDVFDGSLVPGEHTLTVTLEYRGHGFGVFSYLRGYRFRVRSSYVFTVPEGRQITLNVTGFEDGGPSVPLEDRPAIRFGERVEELSAGDARTEAPPAEAAPTEESAPP